MRAVASAVLLTACAADAPDLDDESPSWEDADGTRIAVGPLWIGPRTMAGPRVCVLTHESLLLDGSVDQIEQVATYDASGRPLRAVRTHGASTVRWSWWRTPEVDGQSRTPIIARNKLPYDVFTTAYHERYEDGRLVHQEGRALLATWTWTDGRITAHSHTAAEVEDWSFAWTSAGELASIEYDGPYGVRYKRRFGWMDGRFVSESYVGAEWSEEHEVVAHDGDGRPIESVVQTSSADGTFEGGEERWTYDGDGNLLEHRLGTRVRSWTWEDGRLVRDEWGATYTYDDAGRVTTITDHAGQLASFEWDEDGALRSRSWDHSSWITYEGDCPDLVWSALQADLVPTPTPYPTLPDLGGPIRP